MASSNLVSELLDKNSSDPRTRLEIGPQLYDAINTYGLASDSTQLTRLCDVMGQWLSASNFKVALQALEIIEICLATSGDLLAPYLLDNMSMLMERLGDTKEQVRAQTHEIIIKFMNVPHSSPQLCLEKLSNGFVHKQFMVRVECMKLLQAVLTTYGSNSLQLNKFIPSVCKNISDAQALVRDTASDTLVSIYIVMGDALLKQITAMRLIPDQK